MLRLDHELKSFMHIKENRNFLILFYTKLRIMNANTIIPKEKVDPDAPAGVDVVGGLVDV